MAICRNCGKPLVVSDGKCVHCGYPIQGGPMSKSKSETSWYQQTMRKTMVSIIVALLLEICMLMYKPWPKCIISIGMLALAVALVIFSFQVVKTELLDVSEEEKDLLQSKLGHLLNILLILGGCFFIAGVVCLFISWWAVLLTEIIGIGLFALVCIMSKKYLV